MLFTPEDATSLKNYLCELVASESDADPQVLADFMCALLQADAAEDVLYTRCIEELSVFLEEKTEDIVKRVFSALKDKSYLPKDSRSVTTTDATTTAVPLATSTLKPASSESSKSTETPSSRSYDKEEDDDEDDEDDDTNFKRRSNNNKANMTPETADNGHPTQKRPFSGDDSTDNGPHNKHPRHTSPGGQNFPQQRLGVRRFKKPCFDYERKGYCMRGDFCPYDHGEDHLVVEANSAGIMEPVNQTGNGFNNGVGAGGPMRIKGRGMGMNRNEGAFGGPAGREGMMKMNHRPEDVPYTNRYTPYSTKMVVEKIPEEHCNIDSVTGFFNKFGKLVNLSVQPNVSRAFLQYSSHQEALAAYQSPGVIFNNRFVKVFWQKVNEEEERKEFVEQQRLASLPDPEAVKAKAAQLAKEREERQKKQQEHLKKVLELQKQQQQLIERQIDQQKKLMERYERALPGSKEREEIMLAINNLSDSIKSNKATAISSTTASSSTSSSSSGIPSQAPTTTIGTTASSSSSSSPPQPYLPPGPQDSTVESSPPNAPTTLDAKKAEMERLKAKLASLEAAKKTGYASHRGGRGGMNTWSGRGARTFSLDNRKKATAPAPTSATAAEQTPADDADKTTLPSKVEGSSVDDGSTSETV